MALQVRQVNPNKPPRVLIYAGEGLGKSTFGALSDRPIFITPEGGADQLRDRHGAPVMEIENVKNWTGLRNAVKDLINDKHDFGTVILDSADWTETICHSHIIGSSGKTIVTVDKGYGAGYRSSQQLHKELVEDLDILRNKRGMGVIVTAHAHVKEVKDPDVPDDYDGFEPKLHEMVSSIWREWVDAMFFVKLNTFAKANDDSSKARARTDGGLTVYCKKTPAFYAKNRYGMPASMPFTLDFYNQFMEYARKGVTQDALFDELIVDIIDLQKKLDEPTAVIVGNTVRDAGRDIAQLQAIKQRLKDLTKTP